MSSSSIVTSNTSSKDEDVAFWLHNKLGSHVDLWSSFSISSTLTQEHLLSIKSILWSLDTLVKVKLLLSFIHIPKRNINEWESLLKDIIELSRKDNVGDQWVAVISEIMKTFPDKSLFNLDLTDQECEGFTDGIQELRKTVKKNNDTTHLPLESCYLGKSALKMLTGDIPNPSKCFSLIRKAKSARIRQELLEKSAQTSKTKKISDYATIPGSRRSVDEYSPIYSLTSSTSKQSNIGFLKSNPISTTSGIIGTARLHNRREGNVKLLSLEEEQALNDKKRKKITLDDDDDGNEKKANRSKKPIKQQQNINQADSTMDDLLSVPSTTTTNIETHELPTPNNLDQTVTLIAQPTYAPLSLNEMPATPNPLMNNSANDLLYGLHQSRVERNYSTNFNDNNNRSTEQDKLLNTSTIRNDLKLTNEQITFARELFRTSTCLTRADKSRILAFIAGVRDRSSDNNNSNNPIVTIKLTEKDEIIPDPNTGQPQKYFAETFFQMNTSTGEWKRIKKLRPSNQIN
ncbi:unnamed protein product [Rotaria sordida]|uniref:HDAg domain-containing protein n=1 Tax=Rotaria sordida TaxID=392033 RepID=A0A814VYF3_9BILA|nr:unnamed protein product [Rotaria sordida]CAF1183407.1 unnamed protein product [Rotaria sordida]CAF1191626.1 unnamed protein product [Rotaria sordida]CAF1288556.1 unnamed protein product [Rotaria sordida]CAF3636355.1 unnamed protein product [Rotaria sordida]